MLTYIAVYRGKTMATARMVAVDTTPSLIADVSRRLLEKRRDADESDPAVAAIENGRLEALRAIAREAGVPA